MADDTPQPSPAAQATPHTAELREFVAELSARVAAMEAARDRQARIKEILDSAGYPPEPPPPPKRKRDRHGMHIVRGAIPLGALAVFARAHAKQLLIGGTTAAVLAGGTLAPGIMQQAPAAVPPHRAAAHHHHHTAMPPAPAVVLPGRHRRRRTDADGPRRTAAPQPSPRVSPSAPPAPSPSPSPSVTVPPPVPSPAPTCLHPGKKCHPGDVAGDVVNVLGALRAFPGYHGQPWPGTVSRTSSVRNPGPRLDAGRTVMVKHAAISARRVASGRASNSSRVMAAWAPSSRACAVPTASSRSSARRWSIQSRRVRSMSSWPPREGSRMRSSVLAR